MNAKKSILMSLLIVVMASFSASAQMMGPQFPGERPDGMRMRPERPSAKERAEKRTGEMHKAVNLDPKQYKKIYQIYLKEENAIDSAMESDFPMGPPPGGMGGGRPPQGSGFPGGPGMGGGFPGGPGAGGPPSGMPFPGFGEPRRPAINGKEIDSDEYLDAREAKFRKILTPEQYAVWHRLHPDPSGFFIK